MLYNAHWIYTSHFLYNSADQTIDAPGLAATLFGSATAFLAEQRVKPGGQSHTAIGDAAVTHWLQRATPAGINASAVGTASIGESPRAVSPPWFYATIFGRPFVGEYLTVAPDGIAGQWGTATVASNLQRLYGYGYAAGSIGTQQLIADLRALAPLGYAQTLYGTAEMVPLLRTLLHSYGVTIEDRGFGTPSLRMMTAWADGIWAGVVADRVDVARSGQVINPDGLRAGSIGAQAVAYWERTLAAEGIDSFYSSTWHHARNDARVRSPAGFDAGAAGTPALRNELRTVQQVSPATGGAPGAPWVSFAVRAVAIIEGPPQPLWPTPAVQNWERYLSPAGYATPTTGALYLEHHQNRITTRPDNPHTLFGRASVVNEDREIRGAGGLDPGPRGMPRVSRDPEYLTPSGDTHTIISLHQVRDSRQTVRVSPAGTGGQIPETHWLRKEQPDPPVTQFVEAASMGDGAHYGTPDARSNYIYPSGLSSAHVGAASVVGNGISPRGIPPAGYGIGGPVGTPTLPGLQTIRTPAGNAFGAIGDIDLSPHWIFAPRGIGRGSGEYIDQHLFGDDPSRPRFGLIEVSHQHRSVTAATTVATFYGQPVVMNQERRLPLVGMRLFRAGFPSVGGAVDIGPVAFDALAVGDATVARPVVIGDQTIATLGITGEHGATEVQNQHREIAPSGLDATLFGTQWASHQYEPFAIPALVATEWGDALVQYRDRTIDGIGGTEMLDMTPFPGWSGDRMRVRSRTYLTPTGSVHTLHGTPAVTQLHRTRGVNGIERPQFQVPEGARVRGESTLEPAGLDAGTIGTPSKWQPGDDVQPYGEAMGAIGTTRLSFVVAGSGFDALLTGDIAIAVPIEPAGLDAQQFGQATASHDGGGRICNSYYALAIALAGFTGGIGAPEVAHD